MAVASLTAIMQPFRTELVEQEMSAPTPLSDPMRPKVATQRWLRRSNSEMSMREFLEDLDGCSPRERTSSDATLFSPSTHAEASISHRHNSNFTRAWYGSELSVDLQHLTLSSAAGWKPYCEDIADCNIARQRTVAFGAVTRRHGNRSKGAHVRFWDQVDLDRGADSDPMLQASSRPTGRFEAHPLLQQDDKRSGCSIRHYSECPPTSSPPMVNKANAWNGRQEPHRRLYCIADQRRHSLSHKPDIFDFLRAREVNHSRSQSVPAQIARPSIKRSTLQKPLPPLPVEEISPGQWYRSVANERSTVERHSTNNDIFHSTDGLPTHNHDEDTTYCERWAPAVTHETVERRVHERHEEQVTKALHEYHYYHRTQPIADIEILPARHFIPVEGGYLEVSEDQLPHRPSAGWIAAEVNTKLFPPDEASMALQMIPHDYTAGSQSDYKEAVSPEGFRRSETTWTHPPIYESLVSNDDPTSDLQLEPDHAIPMQASLAERPYEAEVVPAACHASHNGATGIAKTYGWVDGPPDIPPRKTSPPQVQRSALIDILLSDSEYPLDIIENSGLSILATDSPRTLRF